MKRRFAPLFLVVLAWGASASAVTLTRMGDTLEDAVAYLNGLAPPSECVFGHLETPARVGIAAGGLDTAYYAVKGYPSQDCPGCAFGFRLHTIHFLTYVGGPSAYVMRVGLADPAFGSDSCFWPLPYDAPGHGLDCHTDYLLVEFPDEGFYDVAIPIECGCADNSFYPYMVTFGPVSPPPHQVLLDAQCDLCLGWMLDTFSVDPPWWDRCILAGTGGGYPGDVVYYVEADCCESPVRSDASSWSALKALYEN